MIVFATDFSLWKFCWFRLWMVHYPKTSSYKNLRCKSDDHSNWGYVDEIYISTDKLRSFDKPLKMVAQVFRCFFGSKTHLVGGSQSYRIPPLLITVTCWCMHRPFGLWHEPCMKNGARFQLISMDDVTTKTLTNQIDFISIKVPSLKPT